MADERIEKTDAREKKRKRKREKEGRKLVFLRSSTSRGAFRVAIIKAEVTPLAASRRRRSLPIKNRPPNRKG